MRASENTELGLGRAMNVDACGATSARPGTCAGFLQGIALTVLEAASVDDCIGQVVAQICSTLNWRRGYVYRLHSDDPSQPILIGKGAHPDCTPEEAGGDARRSRSFLRNLARKALQTSRAQWAARNDREKWTLLHGEVAVAVPMTANRHPTGAMVFVGDTPLIPDKQHLDCLLCAASHLGLVVQRKHAEQSVSESRHFMQMVADNVPHLLFVYDLTTRRLVFANRRATDLLGYSRGAFAAFGDTILESLVHPEDLPRVEADLRVLRRSALERPVEAEVRLRRASGDWRWFHIRRVPFSRDGNGEVRTFLATGIDVTSSKQARSALAESENRFRTIFSSAACGVVMADREGRITLANPWLQRFVGYSAKELRAKPINAITHPADVESSSHRYSDLWNGHCRAYSLEKRYVRKDGSIIWGHVTVSLLRDEHDEPISAIGIIKDISERKVLEQVFADFFVLDQRRILEFLHNSLGQQLTGIEIMARNLERRLRALDIEEGATAGELVQWIGEAHSQLQTLAKSLRPVEVDASGLAIALEDLAMNTEQLAGICCRVQCDEGVELHNENTSVHLFSIAQHAVANAVQHSGARSISIRLRNQPENIVLTISDNGTGIHGDAMATPGTGIRLMAYRARILDALLTISSGPSGGTVVECIVKKEGA